MSASSKGALSNAYTGVASFRWHETGETLIREGFRPLGRYVASLAGLIVVGAFCCSCGVTTGTPDPETPALRTVEQRIADFAHSRPSTIDIGRFVRCEVRVLGQTAGAAYAETLCSATSNLGSNEDRGCVPKQAESIDTVALASLRNGRPRTLRLDEQDDEGYDRWMKSNFPSKWQAYEADGPRFGNSMQKRLDAAYGC